MSIKFNPLQFNGFSLSNSGGGGGAVTSVNGHTGAVTLDKTDIGLDQVDNTSDADKPISTDTQAALDLKADSSGTANTIVVFDNAGQLAASPSLNIYTNTKGINCQLTQQVNNSGGGLDINTNSNSIEMLQDSPNDFFNVYNTQVFFDSTNSGFDLGTNGNALFIHNDGFTHQGSGDIGSIAFHTTGMNIGNSTDPINVKGLSYMYGFGEFKPNVNLNGPLQGYGFQTFWNTGSTISNTTYTQAFYDVTNMSNIASPNYTSFNSAPSIGEIQNNNNFNGINISPQIDNFDGNSGFFGVNLNPNLGTMAPTGGCTMVNINPTVDLVYTQAYGIYASMDNVTTYTGVQSSLVFQDLTFTFVNSADNNSFTMEYTTGATAGSEVVGISGNSLTVQIEAGVSTATQIKAACDANLTFASNITTTISGTGSNTQIAAGPTNFINGVNPGTKKAAYFDGDVEITGALTFGGALSIGQLSAFGTYNIISGTGNPNSTHMLITQPTLAANESRTLADYLGVNTAMLLNMGDNSSITTGFIGMTALGLPAVVSMGTGSTVDLVTGATFALSLDAGAAGGTIDQLSLCRAIALPNGATTVTRQYGYEFDNPFGDVGTNTWGFYAKLASHNYFAGDLLLGGTPISDDVVANSSVALEINSPTKAFLNARMTTTQRNALTAVNGMQIYNSTDDKLQVYAGGSWIDLH